MMSGGAGCRPTNRQDEVTELVDGYSRPTCNKLCASGHDALVVMGVIRKLDRRRVSLIGRPTLTARVCEPLLRCGT